MSSKLAFIPEEFCTHINVKREMDNDFEYRFNNRLRATSFGRPLYERINLQMVITQACPFHCSFCLERQNPQGAVNNFEQQLESLQKVMKEHPNARVSITGGEPLLYPEQIRKILSIAHDTATFISINTTGALDIPEDIFNSCHFNISDNSEVHSDLSKFEDKKNVTIQTIFEDKEMTVSNIKKYMNGHNHHINFSFRYLTVIGNQEYDLHILEELRNDKEIKTKTFRVGDFFMYYIGEYGNQHFRITLGDMTVQQSRKYNGTYSNIIINPEGEIHTNWKNNC